MSTEFSKAISEVSQVLMFENWLRFYFIKEEEGGKLIIQVPEGAQKTVREEHPHLFALIEDLDGKEITFETSRNAVCTFVATQVDGSRVKQGMVDTVFNSNIFQVETQLFNIWVQTHEEQLDRSVMKFQSWIDMYGEWRSSDKVKAYLEEMRAASVTAPKEGCETVQ